MRKRNKVAYILCIETATTICSVAIFNNEKLIDCIEQDGSYSHAENLAKFVDDILKNNQLDYSELTAIAISKGPGSYTGLRIGVAFAKGLCYAQNLPLIAINTLQALAYGAISLIGVKEFFIIPMIDARRMEVYASVFDHSLKEQRVTSAELIDSYSFEKFLKEKSVFFVGNGAHKCVEVLNHPNAVFNISIALSAKNMGLLANKLYQANKFEDIAYFDPLYLKEFIAIKSKKLV